MGQVAIILLPVLKTLCLKLDCSHIYKSFMSLMLLSSDFTDFTDFCLSASFVSFDDENVYAVRVLSLSSLRFASLLQVMPHKWRDDD